MRDEAREAVLATYHLFADHGRRKPHNAIIFAFVRTQLGQSFTDSEGKKTLAEARSSETIQGRRLADAGRTSTETGAVAGRKSALRAPEPADHSRVVKAVSKLQDSNPHPQPPLLTADPVAEETAVALGGVDASPVPVIPPKLTISAQDPDTDFAPFAEDVAALIAVDRTRHPRKANWSERWLRQSLALWRIKHGDDAFARGIEIGISSGNGCDYARGVMERFNPDRDLRAIDGGRYPYKPGHPLYDQNLDPDFDPDQGFEYTPEAEIHRSPQDIALLQRAGIAL